MKKLSKQLLADAVRSGRNRLGLSQAELSRKTGINRSILSNLENGQYMPSIEQLEELSSLKSFLPFSVFRSRICWKMTLRRRGFPSRARIGLPSPVSAMSVFLSRSFSPSITKSWPSRRPRKRQNA